MYCHRNAGPNVAIISKGVLKRIVGLKRGVSHSYLKAIIGSTRMARSAGM